MISLAPGVPVMARLMTSYQRDVISIIQFIAVEQTAKRLLTLYSVHLSITFFPTRFVATKQAFTLGMFKKSKYNPRNALIGYPI